MEDMNNNKSQIMYQFKKYGYEVSGDVGDNSLYVDVGNKLAKGIIDHHQIREDSPSTVKLFDVKYFEDLLKSDKAVVIYTHTEPDSDAILATYMAKIAISQGVDKYNEIFASENYGYKLIEYVDRIDRGYGKAISLNLDKATFYVAVCYLDYVACALSYLKENDSLDEFDYKTFIKKIDAKGRTECDQYIIEVGHKLIETFLSLLKENPDMEISTSPIEWSSFIDDERIAQYLTVLYKEDYDKYSYEKKTSVNFEYINVWEKDGKIYDQKVKAAIWRELPESEFCYLYARQEDDAVITVVPRSIKEKNEDDKAFTKATISIDPEKAVSNKITLKPLAEALELMEQIEENTHYKENGVWRRDHSRPRSRFEALPFSATADPWFYTKDEMLVEEPGTHSYIEYKNIISLLERHTKLIKTVNSKEYRDGYLSSVIENENMTISRWIERVDELISDHRSDYTYDIIVTEIDAVMIKSRNDVLRALCMSVLGNNVFEAKDLLELDYYSCIYADENCLLAIMASEEDVTKGNNKGRRLLTLIDEPNNGIMKELTEQIAMVAKKVITQRNTLIEIGDGIEKCVGEPVNSRNMYRKYVDYIASEQKDSIIRKLTEQEIYYYLRKMLRIDDMKEIIQDAVDIVTSDSKERVYSGFNYLTAITVPLVLISTFFQMGAIEMDPIFSRAGFEGAMLWKWLIVIGFAVIAGIYMYKRGKK